eukprot:scaffold215902_cov31-Tisochrysis_lutea.AAC.8
MIEAPSFVRSQRAAVFSSTPCHAHHLRHSSPWPVSTCNGSMQIVVELGPQREGVTALPMPLRGCQRSQFWKAAWLSYVYAFRSRPRKQRNLHTIHSLQHPELAQSVREQLRDGA